MPTEGQTVGPVAQHAPVARGRNWLATSGLLILLLLLGSGGAYLWLGLGRETPTPAATTTPAPTETVVIPTATAMATAMPTETGPPTPEATATATTTAPPAEVRINVASASLRNGPDTDYAHIRTLFFGDVVVVLASDPTGAWHSVETADGLSGWVAASTTNPINPMAMTAVPTVVTRPPLIFTPTNTPQPDVDNEHSCSARDDDAHRSSAYA